MSMNKNLSEKNFNSIPFSVEMGKKMIIIKQNQFTKQTKKI